MTTEITSAKPIAGLTFAIKMLERFGADEWYAAGHTQIMADAEAWAAEKPETRRISIQPSGFAKPHFAELEHLVKAVRSRRWKVSDLRAAAAYWPDWTKQAVETLPRDDVWNWIGEPLALNLAEAWAATRN